MYCMPACGINFSNRSELLTYEEMLRLVRLVADLGVSKIRLTGGEPFVRKDFIHFLNELTNINGIDKIHLTTNGTLLEDHIDTLVRLGIKSINLSLDSLDRNRFHSITRRDDLPKVLNTLQHLLDKEFEVKINMVVMANENIDDIVPMLELTKNNNIAVRFLEEMPFNGVGKNVNTEVWNYNDILNYIQKEYRSINKLPDPKYATSVNYSVVGYKGTFGIIAAYSRTFCGSCNRIRLTPQGMLKTCLYDNGVFNIRDLMRAGASDSELVNAFCSVLQHRAKDGHEAEARRKQNPISESMASIGG